MMSVIVSWQENMKAGTSLTHVLHFRPFTQQAEGSDLLDFVSVI